MCPKFIHLLMCGAVFHAHIHLILVLHRKEQSMLNICLWDSIYNKVGIGNCYFHLSNSFLCPVSIISIPLGAEFLATPIDHSAWPLVQGTDMGLSELSQNASLYSIKGNMKSVSSLWSWQ